MLRGQVFKGLWVVPGSPTRFFSSFETGLRFSRGLFCAVAPKSRETQPSRQDTAGYSFVTGCPVPRTRARFGSHGLFELSNTTEVLATAGFTIIAQLSRSVDPKLTQCPARELRPTQKPRVLLMHSHTSKHLCPDEESMTLVCFGPWSEDWNMHPCRSINRKFAARGSSKSAGIFDDRSNCFTL